MYERLYDEAVDVGFVSGVDAESVALSRCWAYGERYRPNGGSDRRIKPVVDVLNEDRMRSAVILRGTDSVEKVVVRRTPDIVTK